MKYFSLFLASFLFFTSSPLLAQEDEEGIHFFHGSIEDLKKEAKAKKKLIFLDAYTEWCGPCKMMSATTFKDKAVGEFFNKNFISYKLDMEKGEGPGMSVRYEVTAYPTLLFMDAKGEVTHKILGYRKPEQLLDEAKTAINPKDNLTLMQNEYENGTNDPEILLNYAFRLADMDKDYSEVAGKYFSLQQEKDLITDNNWKAMLRLTTDIESREFQSILKRKAEFVKKYGMKAVEDKILQVCKVTADEAMKLQNEKIFLFAIETARKNLADNGKAADEMELGKEEYDLNWEVYATKAVAFLAKHKMPNEQFLNQVAWNFYEHVSDKTQLEKAVNWAKQSVALDNAYYNNDTVAALFYKLGKYEDALRYVNKALNLAQEKGEDATSTQALLEKIEAAKVN